MLYILHTYVIDLEKLADSSNYTYAQFQSRKMENYVCACARFISKYNITLQKHMKYLEEYKTERVLCTH
jgi:hypothetical protein